MSLRANQDLSRALIKSYTIKNASVILVGSRIKFGASDTEADLGGANDDLTFGTALNAGTGNATGTVFVDVALDVPQIIAMTVGTGGSTRGTKQVAVANGVTDVVANGGGTVAHTIVGVAMQTGVLGDLIGVMPLNHRSVAAT
jgi:hypothetical protein